MLGDVRELVAAGDVADDVDARVGRAQATVATTIRPWSTATPAASRPRPSTLALRPAATSRCVPATDALAAIRGRQRHADVAAAAPSTLRDRRAELEPHALGGQSTQRRRREVDVLARQDARRDVDDA